jgi:F-type H+-transporting ATPase subunit b
MASISEKETSIGMPQLDFSNFDNQAFWLLIFLVLVFLVIRILVMPRMEETLTNRSKIIEEDIQEAEEFRDKAIEIEKSLNDEIESARIKANEILRNCKEEIKRNTQEALADIDFKIEELVEISEKNIVSLKSEASKEVKVLSKKLAPEIVKALIP